MPEKKQVKWEDLTPEQQNVIHQTIKGASDAAAARISELFGYVPPETTRSDYMSVWIIGPHASNRFNSIPTALRRKAAAEIRKQVKDVTVKYKGQDYKVSLKQPKSKKAKNDK